MAKVEQGQGFRRFSGMIVFILIAATLWLIIKLSDTYTVTVPFAINYVDIPASQIIDNNSEEVNLTVSTTGFKLLNYYFKSKKKRCIDISLKEVKYKKNEDKVYSYSSRFIIDKVGEFMATNTNDITMTDDVQYFTMSRLASKKVRIVPVTNIAFEKQYNYYGEPTATPDSITIYGTVENVNKINEARTKVITLKNVNQNVVTTAEIDLDEDINADVKEVEVSVNVEKYTESEVVVPITIPGNTNMHLYPDKVTVRYIVAMKDYAIINQLSFKAIVDTTDIYSMDVLPVDLVLFPNNTQIISIEPKAVEYIIVQQ